MKNINLSVSINSYPDKNLIKWNKVSYSDKSINIEEFITLIKEGYCFCHVFNHTSNTFTQREKTKANFKIADSIFIDIDDSKIEMNDFINKLSIQPTIAYTTFNNGKNNLYRFRLIYIFNHSISNIDIYNNAYLFLINKLEKDTNISNKDNCCSSVNQQIAGNTNAELYVNENNILDISNIREIGHSNYIIKERGNIIELESPIQKSDKESNLHYSEEYLNDYWKLDYKSFIDKYINIYPFFQNTPLKEVDDDTPYILLPECFLTIKRYWLLDNEKDEEGNIIRSSSRIRKLKDGQHRRKKLFINGILRRFMLININYEYMLMMLVYELYYYIDNRKDKITKNDLFTICNNAMKADLDKYTELSHQEHSKFIVNDSYCIKHCVNRKQARNIAKKMINYTEIGNLYNCLLSDKENLKVMKNEGLNISQKTLTRFKQDNGLTRNYKNKEIGHSNYIIKEERNIIELESPITNTNQYIIEEENNNNTVYDSDYANEFFTKHCNQIIEQIISNKQTNNIMSTKQELIHKLINNVDILLNKLNLIDDINELESKYDILIQYIVDKSKLINNYDIESLLRYANRKYLQIKDIKNMDYRFDEYCFTTCQYAA